MGIVHKRRPHKIAKTDYCTSIQYFVHAINFENLKFLQQKVWTGLGTHLFVKVPWPEDSEVTFSVFRVKLPTVTTSLTTQR